LEAAGRARSSDCATHRRAGGLVAHRLALVGGNLAGHPARAARSRGKARVQLVLAPLRDRFVLFVGAALEHAVTPRAGTGTVRQDGALNAAASRLACRREAAEVARAGGRPGPDGKQEGQQDRGEPEMTSGDSWYRH